MVPLLLVKHGSRLLTPPQTLERPLSLYWTLTSDTDGWRNSFHPSLLGALHLLVFSDTFNCFILDICKAVIHSRNYLGLCLLLGEKRGLKSRNSRTESNVRLSQWKTRSCLFNSNNAIVNIYYAHTIWKTWFLVSLSASSYLIFIFPWGRWPYHCCLSDEAVEA